MDDAIAGDVPLDSASILIFPDQNRLALMLSGDRIICHIKFILLLSL